MKRISVFISLGFVIIMAAMNGCIPRENFIFLLLGFISLFAFYYYLVFRVNKLDLRAGLTLALLARLVLLPFLPPLSDDVYRFMWDGLLSINGHHPLANNPEQWFEQGLPDFLPVHLYEKLNSQPYYSVYPPFAQAIFAITALLSKGNIFAFSLIIKLLIILSEIGIIYILVKLFRKWNIDRRRVMIYALNPLVILEGVGNLHFELFMIVFVLLSLLAFSNKNFLLMTLFLALSISVKMVSAILWPFFIRWLGIKKWLIYSLALLAFLVVLFLPLWRVEYINHFFTSLDLYFRTFEFNASIYYILRELGTWILGYNPIASVGPALGIAAFIIIAGLALSSIKGKQGVITSMVLALTVYLLCSTTVHPWYVLLPVVLSLFTALRYPVLWSAVIWLSYSAYQFHPTKEIMWIISVEYIILFAAIFHDRKLLLRRMNSNVPGL